MSGLGRYSEGKERIHANRFDSSIFSSPLTGPWKNVPRTEYILEWSPGARNGQVWLNAHAKNGLGSGFAIGTWGLAVVEAGGGGSRG